MWAVGPHQCSKFEILVPTKTLKTHTQKQALSKSYKSQHKARCYNGTSATLHLTYAFFFSGRE